jgi:hypothetical protein
VGELVRKTKVAIIECTKLHKKIHIAGFVAIGYWSYFSGKLEEKSKKSN